MIEALTEFAEKVAETAKEGSEKVKGFADSNRPIEKNVEQPSLKDDRQPESSRFSDSERPVDSRGVEQPKLRELSEEKRQSLTEQLGWTDKQLDKCTESSDGVIHYRTDRCDLEGKCSENGVPYKRKIVNIEGNFIEGVFPEMKSMFNHQLSEGNVKASNAVQFKECNNNLKESVMKDPELTSKFTNEQYDDILCGHTPEGYVWHHNEEYGKMQLVKVEDNDCTQGGAAHTGGKALWGGGY